MYKIVQAPNPVLLATAKKVTKIDDVIKKLVAEMRDTLENARDPEGVGLAAPQVGKSLQLFIVKEDKNAPVMVVINPRIDSFTDSKPVKTTKKKSDDDVRLEGCLSLNNVWGVVNRHESVTLSYTDLEGKKQTQTFKDFLATIIQHEVDHLHGVLFPKRVLEQNGTLYNSKKNAEGELIFEEISL